MRRRCCVCLGLLGNWIVGPSSSFVLAVLGILGIYSEFIRPGRVLPGLLGAAALVCGSYFLWRHSPSRIGLLFIVLAAALFILESLYKTYFVAGALASACLAVGACILFREGPGIEAAVAIPTSAAFGALTTFLGSVAKRARLNKRSDP